MKDQHSGITAVQVRLALRHLAILLPVFAALLLGWMVPEKANAVSTFVPAGGLNQPRYAYGAARLDDGRIVVIGGGPSSFSYAAAAEIWSPASGKFVLSGEMIEPRQVPEIVKMGDGRIYVPGNLSKKPEIFDPVTGTFSETAQLNTPRDFPSISALPDGRLLIAGGFAAGQSNIQVTAEVFDPVNGTYTTLPSTLSQARISMTDVTLPDGRILFLGGVYYQERTEVDIFDPQTGSFSPGPPLKSARADATATLLDNGKVLIAGGEDFGKGRYEIYDPDQGMFEAIPGRAGYGINQFPSVTQLPADGQALVLSGSAEIVDTAKMNISPIINAPSLFLHSGFALPDGRIFLFGGSYESESDFNDEGRSWGEGLYYIPRFRPGPPISGKRLNLKVLNGTAEKNCPGSGRAAPFGPATTIAPGCLISGGPVEITASKGVRKRGTQQVRIKPGMFKIRQSKRSGEVNLILWGPRYCGKGSEPVTRELTVTGKGEFKVTGTKAAAFFSRGTVVLQDRCNGTNRVKVTSGSAEVLDYARKRRFTVKKGRVYTTGKR